MEAGQAAAKKQMKSHDPWAHLKPRAKVDPISYEDLTNSEQNAWDVIITKLELLEREEAWRHREEGQGLGQGDLFDHVDCICRKLSTYPRLLMVQTVDQACLISRLACGNEASAMDDRWFKSATQAFDHCPYNYALEALKGLIDKNPDALVWPFVQELFSVPPEDRHTYSYRAPIARILVQRHPELCAWIVENHPWVCNQASFPPDEIRVGIVLADELVASGSSVAIRDFFLRHPEFMEYCKPPIECILEDRLGPFNFGDEDEAETVKWIMDSFPDHVQNNSRSILRSINVNFGNQCLSACLSNDTEALEEICSLVKHFLQHFPLAVNDDHAMADPRIVSNLSHHQISFGYLVTMLRLRYVHNCNYIQMEPCDQIIPLVAQEASVAEEMAKLRQVRAMVVDCSNHPAAEALHLWTTKRLGITENQPNGTKISSLARIVAIRNDLEQVRLSFLDRFIGPF
jgi:hypothetical protein